MLNLHLFSLSPSAFLLSLKAALRCWQRLLVVLSLQELLSWGASPGVPGLWEGGAGADSGELCCSWFWPWVLSSICCQLLSQDAELKGFPLLWSSAAVLFPGPLGYSLFDLALKVFVKNFFLFHEVWQRYVFRKTLEMMFSSFPSDASLHIFFFMFILFFFLILSFFTETNIFFFFFSQYFFLWGSSGHCYAWSPPDLVTAFPPALHTCEHPLASLWSAWSPGLKRWPGGGTLTQCKACLT